MQYSVKTRTMPSAIDSKANKFKQDIKIIIHDKLNVNSNCIYIVKSYSEFESQIDSNWFFFFCVISVSRVLQRSPCYAIEFLGCVGLELGSNSVSFSRNLTGKYNPWKNIHINHGLFNHVPASVAILNWRFQADSTKAVRS